jgi:hypothetical protein
VHVEAPLDQVQEHDCKVENTVNIGAPLGGEANSHDSATAVLPDGLCFHPKPPPVTGNLTITKTAGECQKDEKGGWTCDYEIGIKNEGQDPVGPITIQEMVPADPEVTLDLECDHPAQPEPGGIFTCEIATVNAVPPGSWLVKQAHLHLPDSYAESDKCKVPNTAKIVTPAGGSNENDDWTDDSSTAIAKIDKVIPNPDPKGSVWVNPCDPPALQIEKIADPQVCTKAPGGFECSYDVKVTSVGKDPYHGTLQVDEIIPVGSTLKSFSAPWKCAGVAPAVHCSHPFVDLAPGPPAEFRELKVTIAVPDSFATSGQCAITNEVHTSVAAAVLHSAKGAQYMAKATAQIPPEACGKPANLCPIMQRMPNGGCCPEDQRWNGFACRPLVVSKCPAGTTGKPPKCKPIVVTCPAGTTGTPPNCKPIVCPAGSVGTYPNCHCPTGTTGTPPNCKPIVCPAGSVGTYPNCHCPTGTTGTPPDCKPIVVQRCPAGSVGVYPRCLCPGGFRGTPPNCVAIPKIVPRTCPAGQHLTEAGRCAADEGKP